jgi:type I restriction enzyme R subunit
VEPPRGTLQYQKYFCAAEQGNAEQLKANEAKRVELYKLVAALVRTYGNLANEMEAAGYSADQAAAIKAEVAHYANVRDEVKLGAGEDLDFKQYEAGMRHLLDTYIQAQPSEVLGDFNQRSLIDLIVKLGAGAIDKLPPGIKKDPEAVAETIANNMRKVIVDERALNPKYYDRMSELLDALLKERRQGALGYKAYLARLLDLADKLGNGEGTGTKYPDWAGTGARRALYDFFGPELNLAIEVDRAVRHSKPDSWVGNKLKEKMVWQAIQAVLPADFDQLQELFELVKARDEYR